MTSPLSPAASSSPGRDAFALYRDGLIHSWSRIVTTLGFCLIPLFFVLDYFTMPAELLSKFFWYRLVVTVAVLAQYLVIRKTQPSPGSYLHGYLFTALVGGMIVKMTVDLGGFDSSYYAGLILVIVAVNLLLPWRAVHSAANGGLVLGMYVVYNALFGGPPHVQTVINNLYFLGSTVVIAVAINHTKHRLIEQEFWLRAELLDTNRHLDRSRAELKAARDALWGEMEVAKRIQTALLPKNRRLGNFEVCALMQPAAEVGGDYYDFVETVTGERWVAIGDVSGHGVESGLVMMMTQTSILTTVTQRPGLRPSELFCAINGAIHENISRLNTHRYMTLNVIRLGEKSITIAGKHQDILVYRKASGRTELVSNQGCWLGMISDTRGHVEDQEISLAEGDLALLYTDGVTEAQSPAGEMFGEQRLSQVLTQSAALAPEQVISAILKEVVSFQARQDDDITLVLLRRSPATSLPAG
ncbi:MAG: PP2C family protein-serine/threonine phosphatase [Myxococcota bacterium]